MVFGAFSKNVASDPDTAPVMGIPSFLVLAAILSDGLSLAVLRT